MIKAWKLKQTITKIVEDQLNKGVPIETREVIDRLMSADENCGYDEVVEKMAVIMAKEMHEMMKNKGKFNRKRYVEKLRNLKQ